MTEVVVKMLAMDIGPRTCETCGAPLPAHFDSPPLRVWGRYCTKKCAIRGQRKVAVSEGRCSSCRKDPARPGKRLCAKCIEYRRSSHRRKLSEDPDTVKRNYRYYSLKYRFGVDEEKYKLLLAQQNGRCAVCGTSDPGTHTRRAGKLQYFQVDHDHATGLIRGLLCRLCNIGLGVFKDDPQRLMAAIRYLSHHLHDRTEASP